jgi:hypothetical protein
MAWPGDYINWARELRPKVFRLAYSFLFRQLYSHRFPDTEIKGLAGQATTEALSLAATHRRLPGYFQNKAEFERWLGLVVLREALALLLRHPDAEPLLPRLPLDQSRLLGMVFLDRLRDGEVAAFLGIAAVDVSQRTIEALAALFQLLRQP